MREGAFHHGNLRAVLLERAEVMLREVGTDGISLRELARQAGVSHGAPRSHFIDRQALLDALAERGFDRLTEQLKSSMAAGDPFDTTFRRVAHAYVEFAVQDDQGTIGVVYPDSLSFTCDGIFTLPLYPESPAQVGDSLEVAWSDFPPPDDTTRTLVLRWVPGSQNLSGTAVFNVVVPAPEATWTGVRQ